VPSVHQIARTKYFWGCVQIMWPKIQEEKVKENVTPWHVYAGNIGARREWVVSITSRPFTPGNDSVPIVNETGWTSRMVWVEKESLVLPEFDSRTVQPAANRYTHCAIPTTLSHSSRSPEGTEGRRNYMGVPHFVHLPSIIRLDT
jgi:hypothetical protein